jgi:hypothetical protein
VAVPSKTLENKKKEGEEKSRPKRTTLPMIL